MTTRIQGNLNVEPGTDTSIYGPGNVVVAGDLTVNGNSTILGTEHVNISDTYVYLNSQYGVNSALETGIVNNYFPTSTTDTVGTGGFTAGVPATSNPSVETVGSGTFASGDLVQISNANSAENNGLFEVDNHTGNTLTIRGIGTVATVETFTQNQFLSDSVVSGDIVKVNVSVIRNDTSGDWEVGKGNSTGITFSSLSTSSAGGVAIVRDEKTIGTNGGTFTSGAWQTRTLNTIGGNLGGSVSLGSNQITLASGNWLVVAHAPAYKVGGHQARLRNITDSTTDALGVSIRSDTADQTSNTSIINTFLNLGSSKVFELQHRCNTTQAGNGFGIASGFGTEVYSTMVIQKLG